MHIVSLGFPILSSFVGLVMDVYAEPDVRCILKMLTDRLVDDYSSIVIHIRQNSLIKYCFDLVGYYWM
jgi:hypothetical protein